MSCSLDIEIISQFDCRKFAKQNRVILDKLSTITRKNGIDVWSLHMDDEIIVSSSVDNDKFHVCHISTGLVANPNFPNHIRYWNRYGAGMPTTWYEDVFNELMRKFEKHLSDIRCADYKFIQTYWGQDYSDEDGPHFYESVYRGLYVGKKLVYNGRYYGPDDSDGIHVEWQQPLEYYFAKQFLTELHLERDIYPERKIKIDEKFDLRNYNVLKHAWEQASEELKDN